VNYFPPTISQRRSFYAHEFNAQATEKWLARLPEALRNPIFAADVGTESGIVRDKYRKSAGKLLTFSLQDLKELASTLLDLLPEDVYYDRNLYENKEKCAQCKKNKKQDCLECANVLGQHVMFDIDPENINCPNCGTLEERIKRKSMYGFCYICFKKAAVYAIKLYDILAKSGYQKLETIYSGRGFHIYLEDAECYAWKLEQRDSLAKSIRDQEHIPIDIWVTRGGTKYARLPYSLHGLVGKIVTPIDISQVARLNPARDGGFTPPSFIEEFGKLTAPLNREKVGKISKN
jgi:DNA primase catalytic subunit